MAVAGIGGFTITTEIGQPAQRVRLAVKGLPSRSRCRDLLLVYLSCHGLLDARRRLYRPRRQGDRTGWPHLPLLSVSYRLPERAARGLPDERDRR